MEGADSKNAYVLYKEQEGAKKALEADNTEFKGKHLRVTPANQKEVSGVIYRLFGSIGEVEGPFEVIND